MVFYYLLLFFSLLFRAAALKARNVESNSRNIQKKEKQTSLRGGVTFLRFSNKQQPPLKLCDEMEEETVL